MSSVDSPCPDSIDQAKTQMSVYCDFYPEHARDPYLADDLRNLLIDKYTSKIEGTLQRISHLPTLQIYYVDDYVELVVEAREVYVGGHFYACVAMCGIATERIVKDIFRRLIYVRDSETTAISPSEKAFEQLERVDISSLSRFLKDVGAIDSSIWKKINAIIELRNQYAHARGKNPEKDASQAIEHLHGIIDQTFSVLKNYTIVDGKYVPINSD